MTTETLRDLSVAELEIHLEAADKAYYDQDNPTMTDGAYDALVAEYQRRTGIRWMKQGSVGDIAHTRPMLSLTKVKTLEAVVAELGVTKAKVVGMPKIDGGACSLIYDAEGKLVRALTRGKVTAGVSYGEDITESVRQIPNVPQQLPDFGTVRGRPFEVRGELYLPRDRFEAVQAVRTAAGDEPFKNVRNACTGIVRKENSPHIGEIRFVAYNAFDPRLAHHEDFAFKTFTNQLEFLFLCGFECPAVTYTMAVSELTAEVLADIKRENLEKAQYALDGVVLMVDDMGLQRTLGYSSNAPRFAVAFKFEDETAETILKAILWEASRTGRIVPRYQFEPVELEGTTVEFATGHNLANLVKIGAIPGDRVVVQKNNQIIPQVIRKV